MASFGMRRIDGLSSQARARILAGRAAGHRCVITAHRFILLSLDSSDRVGATLLATTQLPPTSRLRRRCLDPVPEAVDEAATAVVRTRGEASMSGVAAEPPTAPALQSWVPLPLRVRRRGLTQTARARDPVIRLPRGYLRREGARSRCRAPVQFGPTGLVSGMHDPAAAGRPWDGLPGCRVPRLPRRDSSPTSGSHRFADDGPHDGSSMAGYTEVALPARSDRLRGQRPDQDALCSCDNDVSSSPCQISISTWICSNGTPRPGLKFRSSAGLRPHCEASRHPARALHGTPCGQGFLVGARTVRSHGGEQRSVTPDVRATCEEEWTTTAPSRASVQPPSSASTSPSTRRSNYRSTKLERPE